MSSIFILTHAVPDFHHVRIIPVIRTRMTAQVFLHIQNLQYAPGFPGAVVLYTIEAVRNVAGCPPEMAQDRKSTRLNSSHLVISYAVFCLKKKKKTDRSHEETYELKS